ncbi:reverse transcriptase zinc-binding domain-containing protein [Tanacetum coccineum]
MISYIWSLLTLKESLWVKWIHAYKIKDHSFWNVPFRGNMTRGWRKILQLRPLIWQFIWSKVGNGNSINIWLDRWCSLSPLSGIISARDIHRAGFSMTSKLSEVSHIDQWVWPHEWYLKYPSLSTIDVPPTLMDSLDTLEWRHVGLSKPFTVMNVWEAIWPRGDDIHWCDVVWFSQCIPRHAFDLWLVIKRKLKTQDNLRQWDVSSDTNLNLFQCPLCVSQPDSHDHLFFECVYSLQVWNQIEVLAGLSQVSASLNSIVDYLIPISKRRSARGIVAKLVFAASSYFIWQERNYRLFKNQKRSPNQLVNCSKNTVRLKLLTCTFKKTRNVMARMHLWKLPDSVSLSIS